MSNDRNFRPTTTREAMSRMADAMTSFDELAVSVPTMQIDLKSVYPISMLRDRITTNLGGDVTQGGARFLVSTDSQANSNAKLASVERGRYVAGMDAAAGIGIAIPTRPVGNQYIEWGYTDFQNGFAVGEDSDGLYVATYKDGTRVKVTRRSEWKHPLDKSYANFILNPADLNIYRINFRWYGTGPWWLKVAGSFDQGPQELPVTVQNNKDYTDAITSNPNQPLSVKIDNNGTADNPLTAYVAGRQFYINGSYLPDRRIVGEFRISQSIDDTDFYPLVAMKQKQTEGFRSASVKMGGVEFITDANMLWEVRTFAAVSGGTDGFEEPRNTNGGQESAVLFNNDMTTLDDPGLQFWSGGFVPAGSGNASGSSSIDFPDLDLPADGTITCLMARTISGNGTVSCSLRSRQEW